MLDAHLLRVAGPARVIVCMENTHAVIELQLSRELTPPELARARLVNPIQPLRVRVRPGEYANGAFAGSDLEAEWPSAQARRPAIRKRKLEAR
jgi:hypothetical protein